MASADVVELCDDAGEKFRLPAAKREVVTSAYCAIQAKAKFVVGLAERSRELMACMKVDGPESETSLPLGHL